MIAYIDSSVLLRVLLAQRNALREWHQIERGVSSALIRVECLRTLDRLHRSARLSDSEMSTLRATLLQLLDSMHLAELNGIVLERAAQPMPTELGTLDAIHLATALLYRETLNSDLIMATHDNALATAAKAHGFRVVGIS